MSTSSSDVTPDGVLLENSAAFDRERERIHRQMLSSVSHDLKTPLASIIGSLEVIERMKDKLPENKKGELIHVALHEAYRLDTFITNILDMAKLDNSMVKARHEHAEIGALLRNCLMRMDHRLRGSSIHIENSEKLDAMTDPVLLSRTVCLILDNAVKYGGAPPIIHITYGPDANGLASIAIHDNGQGILPERMEVIFSKYTRFAMEDQQNAGTGLGLAICSATMRLLGGQIISANHPEGGAVFTLQFPIE